MNDASQTALTCPRCRTEIPSNAQFCSSCGAKLSDGGSYIAYGLKVLVTLAVIGSLGALYVYLGEGGGLSALVQKEVAPALVRQDLGLDVAVQSSPYLRQQYGSQAVQVTITNLRTQPVVLEQVVFNGSIEGACVKRPNQTLREGGAFQTMVGGFFGMCGNIIRVSIKTDRGEQDYRFQP